MHIILAFLVVAAIILPIRLYQAKGGRGAKREYERAFTELDKTGRTVVRASWRQTVELDIEGFKYRSVRVSWLNITKPLVTDRASKHSYPVIYYCKTPNDNLGKKRMFADTKSEFIEKRGVLPEFYKMGTNRVLFLMNKLREQAHRRHSQGIDIWHDSDEGQPTQSGSSQDDPVSTLGRM